MWVTTLAGIAEHGRTVTEVHTHARLEIAAFPDTEVVMTAGRRSLAPYRPAVPAAVGRSLKRHPRTVPASSPSR